MKVKRDENSKYEWTKDGKLKSIYTKTITTTKNKKEIEQEIESYKNLIEAGKSKIKAIKNERKNLKLEIERIKKDIESANKRIKELTKYLGEWGKAPKP